MLHSSRIIFWNIPSVSLSTMYLSAGKEQNDFNYDKQF